MPGQLARDVRRLAGQVFHLVEEIIQLAGVGIPAVVRIAVARLGGQPGEDVIESGAQPGGRVGARLPGYLDLSHPPSPGREQVADPVLA